MPPAQAVGGRGRWLADRLADHVETHSDASGTRVRLEMTLSSQGDVDSTTDPSMPAVTRGVVGSPHERSEEAGHPEHLRDQPPGIEHHEAGSDR